MQDCKIMLHSNDYNLQTQVSQIKNYFKELIITNGIETEQLDYSFEKDYFHILDIESKKFQPPKLISEPDVFVLYISDPTKTIFMHPEKNLIFKPIINNSFILNNIFCILQEHQNKKTAKKIEDPEIMFTNPLRDFITISSLDKIDIIRHHDIIYLKSDGKYTEIITTSGKSFLSSKNLGEYEPRLPKRNFFRIHNSYIVNLDSITQISRKDGHECILSNNYRLPISKRRYEEFMKFLK